jgi:hypothetical protein
MARSRAKQKEVKRAVERRIRGWSDHGQESGDLHTLASTFIMWGNNSQFEKGKVKRKKENLKRETRGPVVRRSGL